MATSPMPLAALREPAMQPPPPPGPEPSANVGVRSRQTPLTPWILLRLIEKSHVPPPVSGPLVSFV